MKQETLNLMVNCSELQRAIPLAICRKTKCRLPRYGQASAWGDLNDLQFTPRRDVDCHTRRLSVDCHFNHNNEFKAREKLAIYRKKICVLPHIPEK